MQILNQMADRMFPGKYQSAFAVQVTWQISYTQQFTITFADSHLAQREMHSTAGQYSASRSRAIHAGIHVKATSMVAGVGRAHRYAGSISRDGVGRS